MCVNQSGKKNRVLGRVHTQPIPTHPAIPIPPITAYSFTPLSQIIISSPVHLATHHPITFRSIPSTHPTTLSHTTPIPFHPIHSSHHLILIPPYPYPVPSHPLIPPPYPTLPLSRSIPFTHPTFLSYSLPPVPAFSI